MQNRRYKDAIAIKDLIYRPKHQFASIFARARKIHELDVLIQEILGEPLNQHCRVMNLENHLIILRCDSACWAAKLRYESIELIQRLRFYDQWSHIHGMELKVR